MSPESVNSLTRVIIDALARGTITQESSECPSQHITNKSVVLGESHDQSEEGSGWPPRSVNSAISRKR